ARRRRRALATRPGAGYRTRRGWRRLPGQDRASSSDLCNPCRGIEVTLHGLAPRRITWGDFHEGPAHAPSGRCLPVARAAGPIRRRRTPSAEEDRAGRLRRPARPRLRLEARKDHPRRRLHDLRAGPYVAELADRPRGGPRRLAALAGDGEAR